MQYFFDTSAFVKYYHTEAGSQKVTAIFAETNRQIRVSSLGVLETQSVFAMKVRVGELDRQAAAAQLAMMMVDIGLLGSMLYAPITSLPQHSSLDDIVSCGS